MSKAIAIIEFAALWIARSFDRALGFVLANLLPPPQTEEARPAEPRRLTIADQWDFLTRIIKDASNRAEEAATCHASAMVQLDLAQYAIISLVDELSSVMSMGGRQRRATVYAFDPAPQPAFIDAIAA